MTQSDGEPDEGPTLDDLLRWRELVHGTREIPEYERAFLERYAASIIPAASGDPAWADLVRPQRELPSAGRGFTSGPPTIDEVPRFVAGMVELPENARGIVSAAGTNTDAAPPVAWAHIQEIADWMERGNPWAPLITNAPEGFTVQVTETRPRQAGKMMEMIGRIMDEVEEARSVTLVLGPAKWAAIMGRATPEERETLEAGKRAGRIVLSPHLPEPDTAYRVRVEEPRYVPWLKDDLEGRKWMGGRA